MELLNIVRARSIWLFDLRDINPRGKYLELALISWLKDYYTFTKYPSSLTDIDQTRGSGLVFSGGSFYLREDLPLNVDLSIYNDGLVGDTRSSTSDTDAFVANVISSAVEKFDLVFHQEMIRRKLYVSELHVRSNRPLSRINPRLETFTSRLASLMGTQKDARLEPSSIGFWPAEPAPEGALRFIFERQLNTSASEQRYYSSAPLQTDDHLQLLNEFEDLLIG